MARNEEKANAMLNRFVTMKQNERIGPKLRRPLVTEDCTDLGAAERWLSQVMREINKKTIMIQNAGLGEHKLRDLNDEINKLLREKQRWEERIFELGGNKGLFKKDPQKYIYFGATKQLPGIKELLEKEAPEKEAPRRTRSEMYKMIDFEYFGYRDEEDGSLVSEEMKAEKKAIRQAMKDYRKIQHEKSRVMASVLGEEPTVGDEEPEDEDEDEEAEVGAEGRMMDTSVLDASVLGLGEPGQGKEEEGTFIAHVPLPTREQLERELVEKKKQILLKKYASEETLTQDKEAKALLNIRR